MSTFHSIFEVKLDGEWECVTSVRDYDDMIVASDPPLFGKDTTLGAIFGVEADVELDPDSVVAPIRGLPDAMSALGSAWAEDHRWCEKMSYVYLSELMIHDWMLPVDQRGVCTLADYWDFVMKDRSGMVHEDDVIPVVLPSFIQSPEQAGKIIGEEQALQILDAIESDVTWQSFNTRKQKMAYLKAARIKQKQPLVLVQWTSPLYKAAGQLWSRAMPMMITRAGTRRASLTNIRLTFAIE